MTTTNFVITTGDGSKCICWEPCDGNAELPVIGHQTDEKVWHVFHRDCIAPALMQAPCCPICQSRVVNAMMYRDPPLSGDELYHHVQKLIQERVPFNLITALIVDSPLTQEHRIEIAKVLLDLQGDSHLPLLDTVLPSSATDMSIAYRETRIFAEMLHFEPNMPCLQELLTGITSIQWHCAALKRAVTHPTQAFELTRLFINHSHIPPLYRCTALPIAAEHRSQAPQLIVLLFGNGHQIDTICRRNTMNSMLLNVHISTEELKLFVEQMSSPKVQCVLSTEGAISQMYIALRKNTIRTPEQQLNLIDRILSYCPDWPHKRDHTINEDCFDIVIPSLIGRWPDPLAMVQRLLANNTLLSAKGLHTSLIAAAGKRENTTDLLKILMQQPHAIPQRVRCQAVCTVLKHTADPLPCIETLLNGHFLDPPYCESAIMAAAKGRGNNCKSITYILEHSTGIFLENFPSIQKIVRDWIPPLDPEGEQVMRLLLQMPIIGQRDTSCVIL